VVDESDPNSTAHLRSLVASVEVRAPNGSGGWTAESRTSVEYDVYTGANHAGLLAYSFAAGDPTRNPRYATEELSLGVGESRRGNATAVTSGIGTDQTTSFLQYDNVGNVVTAIDGRATTFTATYSSTYGYAYPTQKSVTVTEADNTTRVLTTQASYDLYTGVVKSTTGYNAGETISYSYFDALDRLTQASQAGGSTTGYSYSGPGDGLWVMQSAQFDASTTIMTTTSFDGLGRPTKSERTDVGGKTVVSDTTYDALGRPRLVTNPYRVTSSGAVDAEPTNGSTVTSYDQLSRVTRVESFSTLAATAGSSTGAVTTSYLFAETTVTDQGLKARKSRADALGRLVDVTEDPGGLGYLTTYGYDARGNLRSVSQGAQTRSFTYDSLGRLKTAGMPECVGQTK
jgi:YD repeat-containing protein